VDQIAQGLGGLMSVTGEPGSGPWRVGIPISDLCAGLFLAQGILVALIERERSGKGQWLHTSLLESMIAMLDFQATRWLIDGEVPPQAGNDHPTGVPTGVFETKDGYMNIAASGGRLWLRFLDVIGMPELAQDPRFAQPRVRSKNRAELREAVQPVLRTRTSAEWVEALNAAGVPSGPVLSIDQTFADEQVKHLDMAKTVQHPLHGELRILRSPVNLTRTPASVRKASPVAGADTEEVLAEYGFSASEIDALMDAGVVGRGARVAAGAGGDIV
jgi:formyl-CoA transferase